MVRPRLGAVLCRRGRAAVRNKLNDAGTSHPCLISSRTVPSSSLRRCFASSADTGDNGKNGTKPRKEGYVIRTLYRQCLRWTVGCDPNLPLSTFVPPVTISPPVVDAFVLRTFAERYDIFERLEGLPHSARLIVRPDRLTFPIHRAGDVRTLFRLIFRLNAMTAEDTNDNDDSDVKNKNKDKNKNKNAGDVQKEQISLSFNALRCLHELTEAIDFMKEERSKHLDRTDVTFKVGQVVQHKEDRWRGVIVGWERIEESESSSDENRKTSLTTKNYSVLKELENDDDDDDDDGRSEVDEDDENDQQGQVAIDKTIQYNVILDSGDAHLIGGAWKVDSRSGGPLAFQSDLEFVEDTSLCRIRSAWISNLFERFDIATRTFVPNETLAYKYPNDQMNDERDASLKSDTDKDHVIEDDGGDEQTRNVAHSSERRRAELNRQIVTGVQEIASQLERHILDATSCADSRGLQLLASFQKRLALLSKGEVLSEKQVHSRSLSSSPDSTETTMHLRHLFDIHLEIGEMLSQRDVAKECNSKTRFRLGDIVLHKKYGFRGVVVAWDPRPVVDISRWDGLDDIPDASEKPFYHVVPDQEDCIRAFGGERPFRYVCEDNLQSCPRNRSSIVVDLDSGWEKNYQEARYDPPDELKFKYGEDVMDDDVTSKCFAAIQNDMTRLQLSQRGSHPEPASPAAEKVSLEVLFEYLRLCESMDGAIVTEEVIKEIWKAHPDGDKRRRLNAGIADLLRGKQEGALETFQALVRDDPEYAEAWNKVSTCHFMLGDMQASLESVTRTLELMPEHFQALNGLGLIQYETRRYRLAAQTFRRSLELDPWSPVSCRLRLCLDMLHGLDLAEESQRGREGGGGDGG